MKLDVLTVTVLVFVLGVCASALGIGENFTSAEPLISGLQQGIVIP